MKPFIMKRQQTIEEENRTERKVKQNHDRLNLKKVPWQKIQGSK